MDVVREAIARLKGDIRISSEVGRARTLELSLPITLAITQVLHGARRASWWRFRWMPSSARKPLSGRPGARRYALASRRLGLIRSSTWRKCSGFRAAPRSATTKTPPWS